MMKKPTLYGQLASACACAGSSAAYLEFERALRAQYLAEMTDKLKPHICVRLANARAKVKRSDPRYLDALRNAARGTPWEF
jgi:hypothetical protein